MDHNDSIRQKQDIKPKLKLAGQLPVGLGDKCDLMTPPFAPARNILT